MKLAARVDRNQEEIVNALRKAGRTVLILSQVGHGCPDLLVASANHGNILLEVKYRNGKLTPDEVEFFSCWLGEACIVRTAEEALAATE